MKLTLENVRLAFPELYEPTQVNGQGDFKYRSNFILSPTHPAVKKIDAIFVELAKKKWKDRAGLVLKQMKDENKLCFYKKPRLTREGIPYNGYEGNFYISASNKAKPRVLDVDGKTQLTAFDGKIYGGCYVYAYVEFYAQDNKFGQRINCTLRGVQFFKDGDAFSGGAPASLEEFGDLSDFGLDEGDGASSSEENLAALL
jgi:hypothetical protein